MSEWQPIETAPKDGARVILGNANGIWMADWRPVYVSGYQPECPWSSAMLNHDHMVDKSGRYSPPTHWMPLPPPPGVNAENGGGHE